MLREIEKSVSLGCASFEVFVLNGTRDAWEPGILDVKKSGYSIKVNGPNNGVVVVNDKYAITTVVDLAAEDLLQFCIVGPEGVEQYLCAYCDETDVRCSRDAIVLTMRLFIKRAVDKELGKKKKRGLFF
ncbi:uncharacterized protein LOC143566097 [Bidens hawaiensis]|uniref:uncharacterized protein LOC143566097 n=1 Tax=Bidens hawaiensis TaxID=980011 RepID=UPI0040495661